MSEKSSKKSQQVQASIHSSLKNKPSSVRSLKNAPASPKSISSKSMSPKSISPKSTKEVSKEGSSAGSQSRDIYDMIAEMKKGQNLSTDRRSGSRGPANVISKLRMISMSNVLSAKLAKSPFTRRDGLIGFVSLIVVLIYTYFGAGVIFEIEKKSTHCPDPMPCLQNCTIPDPTSNVTFFGNETLIDPIIYTALKNETEFVADDCHTCIHNDATMMLPSSFLHAVIYTFTIMTTIGYGHVVASGDTSKAIFIVYAFFVIPIFYLFIIHACQLLRDQFARCYDRLMKRRQQPQPNEKANILNKCPDLIPFVIMFTILAIYLFAVAGIFVAFKDPGISRYFDAFYYLYQSTTMIGFGDRLPQTYPFQLFAIPFIILGIVLMVLCQMVPEEWVQLMINAIVDRSSGKKKKVDKPLAEQTLEEMMALQEDEQPLSPTTLIEPRRPYIAVPPSLEKLSSRRLRSIHSRPFSVSRVNIMHDLDDEMYEAVRSDHETGQPELM